METLQISLWVVALLVVLAVLFDFMNGFHDAANSIATVVSTGVLKPTQAVVFAAAFNLIAIFVFHLSVAATVGKGIVEPGVEYAQVVAELVAELARLRDPRTGRAIVRDVLCVDDEFPGDRRGCQACRDGVQARRAARRRCAHAGAQPLQGALRGARELRRWRHHDRWRRRNPGPQGRRRPGVGQCTREIAAFEQQLRKQ